MTTTTPDETVKALDMFIGAVEPRIAEAEPLSQRARALTSLVRFAERARQFVIAQEQGQVPFRLMAAILEMRDMARTEQAWVDAILRDAAPDQGHLDRLHLYKLRLAQVEQTAMMSLGYVGSEKEPTDEAAWWARRGGSLIMETIALGPQMLALPSDRVGPPEEQ